MSEEPENSRELGYYLSLAQVGMEMVAPIGIGVALDYYLAWRPWGVIGGAIFGFIGGMAHLLIMVNRHDAQSSRREDKK
jgi:F0F1-type ATP synthase assembly protein I